MALSTEIVWSMLLLFGSGVCYFGVRHDKPMWSFLAFVAGVVLAVHGCINVWVVAQLWSGQSPEHGHLPLELVPSGLLVFFKKGLWLAR